MLWFNKENISIIFSQKSDGDMVFKTNDSPLNEKIKANRQRFFNENNIDASRLVNIYGAHKSDIFIVDEKDLGSGALNAETRIEDYDGLITNAKNSYLMITGADCFPVFFWDENKDIIAAAHCGWRGILKQLPAKMIDKFKNEFSSNPNNINIWIGPGIKTCHYEVSQETTDLFFSLREITRRVTKDYKNNIIVKDAKIFLDLAGIITTQIIKTGVKLDKIATHPDCTFCEREKWFSHRRDKTEIIEANAFIINLK